MKKILRAAIYEAFLAMGRRALLPVDPHLYSLVQTHLANSELCGTKSRLDSAPLALPPPPPPKPPRRTRGSAKKRPAAPPKPPPSKRQMAAKAWEIDSIVEESGRWGGSSRWLLVKWAGYQPDWEKYRIRGAVGSPVETWEPLRKVARTQALKDWDAAKQQ
jgi:hypothetical protein